MNAYDYFKKLNRYKQTQGSLKRTSDDTGVSRTSIKRLWKEKVVMMNRSRHSLSSFSVKGFFPNLGVFIAALNRKRQYLIII